MRIRPQIFFCTHIDSDVIFTALRFKIYLAIFDIENGFDFLGILIYNYCDVISFENDFRNPKTCEAFDVKLMNERLKL